MSTEFRNSSFQEVMEQEASAIRKEMEKRIEYAEKVEQPKDAGNSEYILRDGYLVIKMFYPLPADFCEIIGEQFALGAENDSYEFRITDGYENDFEEYCKALSTELRQDGIGLIPVIRAEKERRTFSFPCSLRGIVSINVAKREYGLFAECVKVLRRDGTGNREESSADETADAGKNPSAEEKKDQRFLCDFIHEERTSLIQKPEIAGLRRSLDEMDPLMKFQTFGITPFLALCFLVAAYFSLEMQATGESGPGQTFFLAAMGIGLFVFSVYNTVIRVKRIKIYNENIRETNRKNRDAYEAALKAEEERYRKELEEI